MVGAIIGSAVTILLAIIASAWRISGKLSYQDAMLSSLVARVTRIEQIVDPNSIRNRDKRRRM